MEIFGLTEEYLLKESENLRSELVPIPSDASDVCPMCRSWRHAGVNLCSNCLEAHSELAHPCPRVVPITLYRKPSLMRDWLTYYKPRTTEYHPEYSQNIAAIIGRFMIENKSTLWSALGGYSVVCTVPSSERTRVDALSEVIFESDVFGAPTVNLLKRGTGDLGHRVLSDEGFVPTRTVAGERILLLDDVYTTGSRAQSAASALQLAGGTVAAIVVVARRIDPDFNSVSTAVWTRQRALPYDFCHALAWLRLGDRKGC